MKLKSFKLFSIFTSVAVFITSQIPTLPAKSGILDGFGRCGSVGEGHVTVTNNLRTTVYVLTDKNDKAGGPDGAELAPGQSNRTPICNRNGLRVKVYTSTKCGKTFLSESRFSRVYDEDFVSIKPSGFAFRIGDILDVGSRIGGVALTYIAAGYGIPPEALSALGVNEAEVTGACLKGGIGCARAIYKYKDKLPSDLLTTINADKCLVTILQPQSPPDSSPSGKSLFLHNRDSSQLAVWLMNGTTVAQGGEPQSLEKWWEPISSGDFNGDGKADVLLYNRSGSQLAVWIMNGTTVSQGGEPQTLSQGWEPISSGDFNGDGKADVLLYNHNTSQLAVWIMNGTTVAQGGEPLGLGKGWVPISSGDFNGDRKADVLLYNRDTSQLAVWIMNGTTVVQGGEPQPLEKWWEPISNGDFNGDGKADVLLYNRSGSQLAVWLMNGTTVAQGGEPQSLEKWWEPISTGDFNRDRRTDILLYNRSGSQLAVWLMNATTVSQGGKPQSLGQGWVPVNNP